VRGKESDTFLDGCIFCQLALIVIYRKRVSNKCVPSNYSPEHSPLYEWGM